MAKIELIGGYIGFIKLIQITKMKLEYANNKDGQSRINRRPYWIYFIYIDYQNEIGIMLIIEMAKIELMGGYIGFIKLIQIIKMKLELC